jgi:hypothetical protein
MANVFADRAEFDELMGRFGRAERRCGVAV